MNFYLVSPIKIVRNDAQSFTYSSEKDLVVGSLVIVEIGKSRTVGVILQKTSKPDFAVKEVIDTLPHSPLPMPLIQTALWMSQYYYTHLATVWHTILPRGLDKKRRHKTTKSLSVSSPNRTKNVFTNDQTKALKTIDSSATGTFLLHGITGSGKTLVYINLAKIAQNKGLSSIILVPEIALTTQLVDEFRQHFQSVIVTHSRQTESERHQLWLKIINSTEPIIVIGPRSALFMPIHQLGLIVIDECHEPSFKQEQSPRYSALRTASILARQHQAKLILGSATPNVSDYFLAQKTNRPIISISQLARPDAIKPDIKLIDMTKRANFNRHHFLSDTLLNSLQKTFEAGQQALIFHNRRGTAAITLCENCGWQAGCPRCFTPLTLHADKHRLVCHICGFHTIVTTSCPDCHHADIIHKGIGTKQIETELAKIFPKQSIARFDGDTDNNYSVDQRYTELRNGTIDLIIGTQVIAKGLDLPNLRTVGVVQADAGLNLPDFTAPERTFQLLAQVIGRVGRSHHPTTVIVQSFQPNHIAIKTGLAQNYHDFYQHTIKHRQSANFPPFCHLLKLTCVYKTEATAIKNSRTLAKTLRNYITNDMEILGPTPAFYERVRDTYRWQLIIKAKRRQDLVNLLSHVPQQHWQAELDPISLL